MKKRKKNQRSQNKCERNKWDQSEMVEMPPQIARASIFTCTTISIVGYFKNMYSIYLQTLFLCVKRTKSSLTTHSHVSIARYYYFSFCSTICYWKMHLNVCQCTWTILIVGFLIFHFVCFDKFLMKTADKIFDFFFFKNHSKKLNFLCFYFSMMILL